MPAYAYFPGCSLEASAKEFDTSFRAVFDKIGVGLKEIPDWSCCGSSQVHKVDKDVATAIAGRNLVLASDIGDIVAPCAFCSISLKEAIIKLEHEGPIRSTLIEAGLEYLPGSVSVISAVEATYRAVEEGLIDGKVQSPLTGLKVAAYYGCLLVRPPKIAQFDDPENPSSMERIMVAVGAAPVDWSHKTECCGNAYIFVNKDMTLNLVRDVLNAAIEANADAVVTACPLCQQNLAMRQPHMKQNYGLKREIPVLYFTQLMGAAMNIDGQQLGLSGNIVRLINKRQQEAKEVG
ncbi:MAG: CoB--CoM heterodisulfide reductase iron-sulfur subunit B family protein [Actinobacteria bacterium]|nr:CoB--CoM heterodisulfide reductase iron-sulfur subunit B family protein [Actinomycetota bacterium]